MCGFKIKRMNGKECRLVGCVIKIQVLVINLILASVVDCFDRFVTIRIIA